MISAITILLVEDEPLIGMVVEESLTSAGYEVVMAANGSIALAEIERDAARFRAIITDIRIGGSADGWQVAKRAREIVPHIPVVYMSGDSAQEWTSMGVPGSVILAKPFVQAQMVTAVSTLITEATMGSPQDNGAN